MTGESRLTLHRGMAVLVGIFLLLTGAGATYLLMRTDAAGGSGMLDIPGSKGAPAPSTGAADAGASLRAECRAPPRRGRHSLARGGGTRRDRGVKRALPLNEPVTIEFIPGETGDLSFACGMNMLRGVVVVQ